MTAGMPLEVVMRRMQVCASCTFLRMTLSMLLLLEAAFFWQMLFFESKDCS
jgi:hypothetical protein